jgi:glycosyltransferase involved in cell wall biosynthesis
MGAGAPAKSPGRVPDRARVQGAPMKISIAMATYNGAAYISEQLDSLSAQTLLPLELVVCDDGSTDGTLSIIYEYAESAPFPVRILQNKNNRGFADNFLYVASLCEGDWIGFCDQDDVWLPHKLAVVADAIRTTKSKQLLMVAHSADLVRSDLMPTGRRLPDFKKKRIVGRNEHRGFWVIAGFACIFSKKLIEEFDWTKRPRNHYTGHHSQSHDKWICMLANALGDVLYLPDSLAMYRRHEAALTGAHDKIGISQRFYRSRLVGADHYEFLSYVARQSSEILEKQFFITKNDEWKLSLKENIIKFYNLSKIYKLRSNIYNTNNIILRLFYMGNIIVRGGYWGNNFYALGTASFVKDFVYSLRNIIKIKVWEKG